MNGGKKPLLSIVIISYNMERELPRALFSLSSSYQKGVEREDFEILVIDNGSKQLPDVNTFPQGARLLTAEKPSPSPAQAINLGLRNARANLVGVLIDGARLASPGLYRHVLLAAKLHHRPVISTLGFHLGPEIQKKSIENGYCQEEEDSLLESVDWRKNGYRLFDISVFAGSSKDGWFMPLAESNALFLTGQLWEELGGYDERFKAPGGGLVNLDTYIRACQLPDTECITLLGEGTFHQVHGGVSTNQNNPAATWDVFHKEYKRIRGKPFSLSKRRPLYLGTIPPQIYNSILSSSRKLTSGLNHS